MNLLLVDGSSFIFRAYYALPALTRRRDGMPVGAVAGFCNMMWNLLRYGPHPDVPEHPTHVAVIFDHPSRSFRTDIYPAYKAHRPNRPSDLEAQFGLVRNATRALGLPCIEQRGWEADDLIATYARAAADRGGRVVIVSSDKDLMQLLGPGVVMVDTMRELVIDPAHVRSKFGVDPEQMIDFLALCGDASDNVPGVPKVGPKTAAALLQEFSSLDSILENIARVSPPRIRDLIKVFEDQARLSRDLVRLSCEVSLDVPIEQLEWCGAIDCGPLLDFCDELELRTLRSKVERGLERAA